jgi:hypothetical protein
MPVVVVSLFAMAYGPFKIVLVYKPHVTRKFFAALLLSIYNSVVVFLKLDVMYYLEIIAQDLNVFFQKLPAVEYSKWIVLVTFECFL